METNTDTIEQSIPARAGANMKLVAELLNDFRLLDADGFGPRWDIIPGELLNASADQTGPLWAQLLDQANLDPNCLTALIYRTAQFDPAMARKRVAELKGFKPDKIHFLENIIIYQQWKSSPETTFIYFRKQTETYDHDYELGYFSNGHIAQAFYYHHAQADPEFYRKRYLKLDYLAQESFALAMIHNGKFQALTETLDTLKKDSETSAELVGILAEYWPKFDPEQATLWGKSQSTKVQKDIASQLAEQKKFNVSPARRMAELRGDIIDHLELLWLDDTKTIARMSADELTSSIKLNFSARNPCDQSLNHKIHRLATLRPDDCWKLLTGDAGQGIRPADDVYKTVALLSLANTKPDWAAKEFYRLIRKPYPITSGGLRFSVPLDYSYTFFYRYTSVKGEKALAFGGESLNFPSHWHSHGIGGIIRALTEQNKMAHLLKLAEKIPDDNRDSLVYKISAHWPRFQPKESWQWIDAYRLPARYQPDINYNYAKALSFVDLNAAISFLQTANYQGAQNDGEPTGTEKTRTKHLHEVLDNIAWENPHLVYKTCQKRGITYTPDR